MASNRDLLRMLARLFLVFQGLATIAAAQTASHAPPPVVQFRVGAQGSAVGSPPPPFSPLPAYLHWAAQKLRLTYATQQSLPGNMYPFTTNSTTGQWQWQAAGPQGTWVAGFLPGCLWEMHMLYGLKDPSWEAMADKSMTPLMSQQTRQNTHDVGFILQIPFGTALLVRGARDVVSTRVLLRTAQSLDTRYNEKIGCTRSWGNTNGVPGDWFQVIMDNMINLELLMQASKLLGGKPDWAAHAISHARRTALDFFRPDGSTFHRVVYSTASGQVVQKGTVQGYADNSTWSRGQAWAVMGFTMMYRETGLPEFLRTAQIASDYFISQLPPDGVPAWDFQAPPSLPYKDTSAATGAATGLIELEDWSPGRGYLAAAQRMLAAVTRSYLAMNPAPGMPPLASILSGGTVSAPHGSFDTGIIFGDYYYLKALRMLQQRGLPLPSTQPVQDVKGTSDHSVSAVNGTAAGRRMRTM
mmetsp:Transcript_21333/g.46609  ORF Transcript_21333/g.46609 Transcript_21333/m.46609 type:complete len:469 (+) Transcript_21333:163-1569(+)|eukprot:CAMPEP_0202894342 /NCGR_PEP_ID=MMETSP1392-20130828/3765_1 /ASSEMBLY_ACC=CAM_ASM_000868 /TAXON_ID=225041 /ORGANISM="Chlamydomonas chlamydogama, Strain SAG 11-48b" /LENGTH=468 /DNA_ID=CAMNT_0049579009 /DNA_START=101 /DNA_END=1507 /DNA_ORIENTATION=+